MYRYRGAHRGQCTCTAGCKTATSCCGLVEALLEDIGVTTRFTHVSRSMDRKKRQRLSSFRLELSSFVDPDFPGWNPAVKIRLSVDCDTNSRRDQPDKQDTVCHVSEDSESGGVRNACLLAASDSRHNSRRSSRILLKLLRCCWVKRYDIIVVQQDVGTS